MSKVIDNLKKYKYFVLVLILLVIGYFYLFTGNQVSADEVVSEELVSEVDVEEEIKDESIKVDIKGAVVNPGVYEVTKNSRVSDVISLSGGLNKYADTSTINLSKSVYDEMVIIVYTKKEVEEALKGNIEIKYVEKECVCQEITNNACIDNKEENNIETNKISLNNATISELTTLNGIGEAKAKLIIEYREANNGFKSIEELLNISGIGDSMYEKIKDFITI